jgi:UDP:flavonoid glycosyltransferase YjiC (YdhE family)
MDFDDFSPHISRDSELNIGLRTNRTAMAKIVVISMGSRGDMAPAVAVAAELSSRVNVVTFGGPPDYQEWIEGVGLRYRSFGAPVKPFVEATPDPTIKNIVATMQFLRQELAAQLEELPSILDGAQMVVRTGLTLGGTMAAQIVGVPSVFMTVCPQVVPSSEYPSPWFRNQRLPKLFNRVGWEIAELFNAYNFKPIYNRCQRAHDLGPVGRVWDHLMGDGPAIIASDPLLGTPAAKSRFTCIQTAYPLPVDNRPLSPEVAAFLAQDPHKKPLFAGFGSMSNQEPIKIAELLVTAARSIQRRIIIQQGWGDLDVHMEGNDLLVISEENHQAIFPHTCGIIHHGGAGTTAAVARAGVPQLIIPHMTDQFWWGERVFERQLGPEPLWRSRLSKEGLTGSITDLLATPRFAQNAARLATKLASCNGAKLTADKIESFIGR